MKILKCLNRRLLSGKRRIDGRNKGQIAIRNRGGSLKRKYRFIEFFRQRWNDRWLFVIRIEYDPNRSAHIALCNSLIDGIYIYILALNKMEVGNLIYTSSNLKDFRLGFTTQVKNIPEGTVINNIELKVNEGSKLSRAAGAGSLLIRKFNENYILIRLTSKEYRLIANNCYATLGTISNINKKLKRKKKSK